MKRKRKQKKKEIIRENEIIAFIDVLTDYFFASNIAIA